MSISCRGKVLGVDSEVAELIRSNIESSLRKCNIDTQVTLENRGMCISASGDVDLWVRLYPAKDNKVSVDFSTVQLASNLQRNGIFTYIFNSLKSLDVVGVLKISSVCTSCMRSWCIGNGLKTEDGFDYFA